MGRRGLDEGIARVSSKRIVDVAGEKALLVGERFDGYRAELVRSLVSAIQTQQEGLSEKGRRDKVGKIVEGLGSLVASKSEDG
jgi:hypothetical protein